MKTKVFPKQIILSILVTLVVAGCSGSNGSTGKTGAAGVTGPVGPVSLAPSIAGLDPTMASFNTIITVTGANFTTTLSDITVYCDGVPAMLISASSTQLDISGCGQTDVPTPYQAGVSVLVNKQMSNGINEWIVPSGYITQFPAASLTGPQGEVYDSTTGKLYIADNAGVFAVDNATGWTTQIVPATASCSTCTLADPAGITMDGSGNIIVTDSYNNNLVGVNPTTGTTWYVLGPGNGLLSTPIGVTYSNGNLYVANNGSSAITQINTTTLSAVNLALTPALSSAPEGITSDGSGNLYVACSGGTVSKIVVSGTNGTVTNSYVTGVPSAYGISISGTSLAMTSKTNPNVYTAPLAGGAAAQIGCTTFPWENGLHPASSVIPDNSSGLFVGTPSDAIIYHVNSACNTNTYTQGFADPYDMTYANGSIYAVNDWFNEPYGDSIFEIRPDGAMRVLAQIEGYGASVKGNPSGSLSVGSWDGSLINVSSTGVTSTVFPLGTFTNGTSGIAYDNSGNLFVNNCGAIEKWNGTTLTSEFAWNTGCYQIAYHNGNIYVSDYDKHRIDVVSASTGGPVTIYVPSTAGLSGPEGIDFDIYGNFYVPDYSNNGLFRIDPQGHMTALVPPATSTLISPNGIAIPPSQMIYTVEEGSTGSIMWVIAP